MSSHIKIFILLLLLACTNFQGIAQEIDFKFINKYSIKNGLSSNNVRKIIQDEFGYMWIATQDGLNRFDGNQFFRYGTSNSALFYLPATDIRDLLIDSIEHTLWVLTNVDGIFSISTKTGAVLNQIKIPFADKSDDWSQCFLKTGQTFWIGCSLGLKKYNTQNKFWSTEYDYSKNIDGIEMTKGTGALIVSKQGHIWSFINSYGLIVFKKNGEVVKKIQLKYLPDYKKNSNLIFTSAVQVNDSVILCGTNNGLKAFNLTEDLEINEITNRFSAFRELNQSMILSISQPSETGVFIGLTNATIRINKSFSLITTIKDKDSDSENQKWLNQVRSMFIGNGFAWFGSIQGLAYFKLKSFSSEIYSSLTSEFRDIGHIYDIEAVSKIELLAGGPNGLFLINRKKKSIRPLLTKSVVNNLFTDQNQNIIVSTTMGNYIYKNNTIYSFSDIYPELKNFEKTVLIDNLLIGDSLMLLGSDDESGLIIWNYKNKTTKTITVLGSGIKLGSRTINNLFKDHKENIWILGDKIITIISDNFSKAKNINLFDPINNKELGPFFDIEETKDYFWLCAYGSGLVQLDKNLNILKIYNESDGLVDKGLYRVFNFNPDKLLISTNNGLAIFNFKESKFWKIFEEIGLHANTFEEGSGSLSNEEALIGGPNGFNIIPYSSIFHQSVAPKLYINSISIIKSISIKTPDEKGIETFTADFEKFKVPNYITKTTISFSGINYDNPNQTTYSYRIKEQHQNWTPLGKQNFIDLIGIKKGTYHIEIQAYNQDGIASEIKTLTLEILPKWYQKLWFKTLVALAIIALAWSFYRLRINQLKKEQRIRTKLASDLHDDLGSTMNSVKLFANMAIMEYPQGKYPPLIKHSAQEAITGIRDMIWVLDDRKDSAEDLLLRISQFAQPLCEATSIQYVQDISNSVRSYKLAQEEKRNLYMMLKESVNNAIKYAESPIITITAYLQKNKPVFVISDQGKGFTVSDHTAGNGLNNLKIRAAAIHYQLRVDSTPGKGTQIRLEKA